MSWTSYLQNPRLKGFTRVTVHPKKAKSVLDYYPLGSITLDGRLSDIMADKSESDAFQTLLAVHDAYMSAECEAYGDSVNKAEDLDISYLLSELQVDMIGAKGVRSTYTFPLLISPEVELKQDVYKLGDKESSKDIDWDHPYRTSIMKRGTRGLCFRGGLAATAGADPQEFQRTLRHETIHLFRMCLDFLDDEMYGANEVDVREEVLAHLVADHFDQLINVGAIKVITEPRALPSKVTECSSINRVFRDTVIIHQIVDVQFDGESRLRRSVDLHPHEMSDEERNAACLSYFAKAKALALAQRHKDPNTNSKYHKRGNNNGK